MRTLSSAFSALGIVLLTSCQVMLPEAARTQRLSRLEKSESVNQSIVQVSRPTAAEDDLAVAATCLEDGKELEAVPHFEKHLMKNPDHYLIRAYLAELLYRLKRFDESRYQFERFEAAASEGNPQLKTHLVHCHTRLMENAICRKDKYGEQLHRGIGLFLLGYTQWEKSDGNREIAEELLCKAVIELKAATEEQPQNARAWWYLHRVWQCLQQEKSAQMTLARAKQLLAFSKVTPDEEQAILSAGLKLR